MEDVPGLVQLLVLAGLPALAAAVVAKLKNVGVPSRFAGVFAGVPSAAVVGLWTSSLGWPFQLIGVMVIFAYFAPSIIREHLLPIIKPNG